DLATARAPAASAQAANRQAALHVKVNTGMNRLGLRPELVVGFLTELAALPTLKVEGIFTHFASADLADKGFAQEQLTRFVTLLRQLERVGLRPDLAHAANSAALLTMPESYLDMVRCGIALYGLHPDAVETPLPPEFRPALTWKAEVAHVSKLEAGERIGYGEEFVASQRMTVAVVPVGYADGFPRRPYHWNTVLIRGQPAPILGRVCMDQTIVDVSEICATQGEVCQGNEVVLLGRQGDRALDVEEIAARLHTNNYDVVSRIMARVPRIYVNQPEDV
ncbi:MAG TPA: alanine racemase, partial [Caldilineaceae bacterium]|nr:alanine racemase [Caldilineaceae bacterium]